MRPYLPGRKSLKHCCNIAMIVCLIVATKMVSASTVVEIIPSIDQGLHDRFNDGSFDEFVIITNSILQTTSFANSSQVGFDVRAAMEFDLAPAKLPGLKLHKAFFIGYVEGTGTPDGFTQLSFDLLGYAGEGMITLADATASDTKIGEFTIAAGFPGFGKHTIPLDKDFVASILDGDDYLGLLTRAELNTGSISIGSSERALNELLGRGPPTLRLLFVVPEPGTLGMITMITVICLTVRRRRI
jgi:hypothetical protein